MWTWFFASCASAQSIDFERDVLPILTESCLDCHGPETAESGYRVDVRRIALRGGDLYPQLVVSGNAQGSPLYQIISGADPDLSMPPDGERLSRKQLRIIEGWINAGAVWPDTADRDDGTAQPLWSLQPLQRPAIPRLSESILDSNATVLSNPVDRFIYAQLAAAGLSLSPPADRRTLIRRLSLVLTGLPPTGDEVDAFVADCDSQAYERLVDRLLASPRFGERWAQHWLDVARFAESDGFETNHERPNAWPYRDYVIAAFNDDQPIHQFIRDQIAGDQWGVDAATGFLVGGAHDIVKGEDADLNITQRMDELADMVNTTATAFLGLTVGCARCHNHKFDPISQTDFYALQAALAGVHHGERDMQVFPNEQRQEQIAALERDLSARQIELAAFRPPVTPRANVEQFSPRLVRWVRFSIEEASRYEPCLDELEVFRAESDGHNVALAEHGTGVTSSGDYQGAAIHQLAHINDGLYGNEHSWIASTTRDAWVQLEFPQPETIDRIVWSRDRGWQEHVFDDRLAISYRIEGSLDGEHWELLASSRGRRDQTFRQRRALTTEEETEASTIVAMWDLMDIVADLEQGMRDWHHRPHVYAGRFEQPPIVYRLHRGDHRQPREEVPPEGLSALRELTASWGLKSDATDAQRRVALADWLANPHNPLPPRVMANRLWQGVFGRGLVATPSDFGAMGAPPTHPELLDWLASELMARGGSMKQLIRLLVTSAAFQQSSLPREEAAKQDAQCRWLWRFPPRRLEGEAIRDRLLFVSDALDWTTGGPGFSLFEPNSNYARNWVAKQQMTSSDFRRMIYAQKLRMEPDAVFSVFDIPDGGQICPCRARSTTPLQALNLFNSEFVLDQAERLAAQIEAVGLTSEQNVTDAFRRILLRDADDREMEWAQALASEHGLVSVCRALLNTNEFLWIE